MLVYVCLIAITLFAWMWMLEALARQQKEQRARWEYWRSRILADDGDDPSQDVDEP